MLWKRRTVSYSTVKQVVDDSLDYLIKRQSVDGAWHLTWGFGEDERFRRLERMYETNYTMLVLARLGRFNRIEAVEFERRFNMKCYTQVYVMNSLEAAKIYCKAFGAEITLEMKNSSGTAYEHCVLSVNGEGILALAEAKNPYDVEVIHKMRWETMTFNAFELGTVDAVKNAFDVLSEGGVVIEEIHEYPWSKCGATVIDKYGVCWWIAI